MLIYAGLVWYWLGFGLGRSQAVHVAFLGFANAASKGRWGGTCALEVAGSGLCVMQEWAVAYAYAPPRLELVIAVRDGGSVSHAPLWLILPACIIAWPLHVTSSLGLSRHAHAQKEGT